MRLFLITFAFHLFWLALSGHYDLWFVVSELVHRGRRGIPRGPAPARGLLLALARPPDPEVGPARDAEHPGPRLPITPTLVRVDAQQNTAVGLTTYGNSITLTPGTLTLEATERGRTLCVHA